AEVVHTVRDPLVRFRVNYAGNRENQAWVVHLRHPLTHDVRAQIRRNRVRGERLLIYAPLGD
ncbi:MAG: hypothetical protein ABWY11_12640, partial [Umezawaea sp.]